ncbi:penicillin-binding transpeptidase domain-containing protein [Clostridium tarantellae]|uniref:Penicillin-binding protein n=1 Tax=Clostridium tarantellae TaxID=39493 RepID=A0A6I1MIH5_9CLOT|nr:penicillin-binding transpeptidase domain-containing protein [Clostridium tarantellae]MPQ42493.1 penicillin-binding protein [Clostridium tarantellae]
MKNNKKKKKPINRFTVLIGIMSIIFIGILCRLVYLQVFKYDDYKERANTRARRFLSDTAPRGKIYDSEGNVLATNKQTYTLTFTETDESKANFYSTMDKVYEMLSKNEEKMQDKFQLKLDENNKFYFDFNVSSEEQRIALELRFKKDRGLNEKVKIELQKQGAIPKGEGDLTVEDEEKIDEKLLQITPEETFDYLLKQYSIYYALDEFKKNPNYNKDEALKAKAKEYASLTGKEIRDILLKYYDLGQLRRYVVVKDAIKMQSFSGFKPVNIASNIKEQTAFIFYQKLNDLPGVDVDLEPIRYYPYNELASSVLGYVSSINSDNKSKYEERGYDVSTDMIGKAGIESAFESTLRGTKGGTTVKVNSAGRKTDELFALETYPGKNVHLSIDKNIQYAAETMLKHQLSYLQNTFRGNVNTTMATRGATVAIEVDTGRVLALASYPNFDPNIFAEGELSPELSKQYFNPDLESFGKEFIDKHSLKQSVDDLFPKNKYGQREDKYDIYPKPFYNYATMGLIPPGSTFKPMSSVVALEEGVFTPDESIYVSGKYFTKYPHIFGKTPPKDGNAYGVIDVKTALKKSSNSYYYDSAVRLYEKYKEKGEPIEGLNSIAKYAWKFGLGVPPNSKEKKATGIEIAENFGSVYNFEQYKEQRIYYAKWDLVNALEAGVFPNRGVNFIPVDIAKNDSDSEDLAEIKANIKKLVTDKLKNVNAKDSLAKDYEEIKTSLTNKLNELYKVSGKYKNSIDQSGKNIEDVINKTASEITTWVVYSMPGEIVNPVELANASIGQGMNAFSPVQLVNYIATLANGGTRHKVHLVDKITDTDGKVVEDFKPEVEDSIKISESTLAAIKEGMRKVNHESGGSGYQTFSRFPITTGGKTGTATFRNDQDQYGRTDFGVYVSFAPLDKPKIAVAVVIYDGGHGYFGAPVARSIYETYFRDELKAKYPSYKPITMDGISYDYTLNPPLENKKDLDLDKGNINVTEKISDIKQEE